MRTTVALAACLLLAPSLFGGAEVPVSTVVSGPAAFDQRAPQIATDGTNFLVVWYDARAPRANVPVYATRLGPDGERLDAASIALPVSWVDVPGWFLATWTGDAYIVFWTDYGKETLYWVRIDRDGRVLDERPHSLTGVVTPHGAASAHGRTLVLFTAGEWEHTRLYGQFIEADGAASGARLSFPQLGRSDFTARAASNGDAFEVLWSRFMGTRTDIVAVPVALDGTIGPERILAPANGGSLLASNSGGYLAAWFSEPGNIVTEQLDAAGTTLVRTTHTQSGPYGPVALAPYGSGYLLVTRESAGILGRVLDAAGRQTGEVPLAPASGFDIAMQIASNPQSTVAVWHEDFDGVNESEVYSEVVDASRDRLLLSESAPRQSNLRIATNGTSYLGAWIETRQQPQLRVGRVSAAGVPLDGQGVAVANGVTEPPALTFDGANYVLAWVQGTEWTDCKVGLTRVTHEGRILDPDNIVSRECTAAVGLGSNGRESLLVRSVMHLDTTQFGIRNTLEASRVRRDLSIEQTVALPNQELRGLDIDVAWNTDTWLVAWTRFYDYRDCGMCDPPPMSEYRVDAARISEAMNLIDASPLELGTTSYDRAPSIAVAGGEFAVAWERMSDKTVHALTIPRAGLPSAELAPRTGRSPSLATRGDGVFVAFEVEGDLFYAPLASPERTGLATSADSEHSVRFVTANGRLTAAYLREASEAIYQYVDRGFIRILETTSRRRTIRK